MRRLALLLFFLCVVCPALCVAADSSPIAGPRYGVQTAPYDWRDEKRDRNVPVKIYFPKTGEGPFPVIIFSHGLGGSRDGYEYLGRYWAARGYVSVHVQHIGSDDKVWKDVPLPERMRALSKAAADPRNITNRPRDISFAIDQVEKLNEQDGSLKHRLDLKRIGVAGHSFGAYTTLAVAGEVFVTPSGREMSAVDPRVKAAIPMSAPVPKNKNQFDAAFAKIKIPCFHMTGTEDNSPIGETKAAERRVPFDHINGATQYLVTFTGGDHMIFSGRLTGQAGRKDAEFQKFICIGSVAFWDAYLKDDVKARDWLANGGFEATLKQDGVFEKKLK